MPRLLLAGGSRLRGDFLAISSTQSAARQAQGPRRHRPRQVLLRKSRRRISDPRAILQEPIPPWAARESVCDFARRSRPTTETPDDSPPAWTARTLCDAMVYLPM